MLREEFAARLEPVFDEIAKNSRITDHFIDKDYYRIYVATFWANLVLNPKEMDLEEKELEQAYELINASAKQVLGGEEPIREAFDFLVSRDGKRSMEKAKLSQNHEDLLTYFASMMLNPDGHRRWMHTVLDDSKGTRQPRS